MTDGKTAPISRPDMFGKPHVPPALVRFHPLDDPPRFSHRILRAGTSTLGRGEDCQIVLDDAGVSRVHARIENRAGTIVITDEASANGVIVDGKRVSSIALVGGEVIRLGDCFFRFLDVGMHQKDCDIEVHTDGIVSGYSLDLMRGLLGRAADDTLSVMILGETGTGKDLAAEYLHGAGRRRDNPFVALNCAAIPATLVESELFGYVKGSFTGASADGIGLLRQAHTGTLFLDEIGEIPLLIQSKLLRVLQDHKVRPVGGTKTTVVDLRIVCATNRDLGALVRAGAFRADLFARLAELVVELPALRDRIEDVPLLTRYFVDKHQQHPMTVSSSALEVLCCRRWPLNVRGLETAVRRALALAGDAGVLVAAHFPADPLGEWNPADRSEDTDDEPGPTVRSPGHAGACQEPDPRLVRLVDALRRHGGSVDDVAKELGLSRSQVYRRAKIAQIDPARFRR
jgi:transcriptional regulator with PAS, ATPase and Fis domain